MEEGDVIVALCTKIVFMMLRFMCLSIRYSSEATDKTVVEFVCARPNFGSDPPPMASCSGTD